MKLALIVDDEEMIGELLTDELAKFGFEVDYATTGEKGIELVKTKVYSFAIIDMKLSTALTGLDVMREIRERQPKTVVVAMTGYIDISMKQEAEHMGVQDFFMKPDDLRPEVFQQKVAKLLEK